MVWPSPMGSGASSYARARNSAGTNSCRGTRSMHSRTRLLVTWRLRICVSTISRRACSESVGVPPPEFPLASIKSRRRSGSRMLLPSVRTQDVVHLLDCKVAFLDTIVKMGRKSHAGLRPEVHQDFPLQQFAAHLVSVRAVDRHGAGPFIGIFRRIDAPSV